MLWTEKKWFKILENRNQSKNILYKTKQNQSSHIFKELEILLLVL